MTQIEFKELSWPAGLNLDLIQDLLSEEQLKELIISHCRENRIQRRLVLPSLKCLKKILFHHLVVRYKGDYDKIMLELRDRFRTLSELNVSRQMVKQSFEQREKEIKQEREK